MRHTGLALGLVAVALVAPSAASAASWSAPGQLAAGTDIREPVVAARPDFPGAAAAWVSSDRVFASTIGSVGGWTAPRSFSPAGVYSTTPTVQYGTGGRVLVAWTQVDGGHQRVAVSARLLTGAWSPAAFVSSAGLDARQVHAVIGRNGKADLVWVQSSATGAAAVGTAKAAIGLFTPRWTSGTLDGSGRNVTSLSLAVGRGGNDSVRAAWDDGLAVRTVSHTATGEWGATTAFEAGSYPQVAVDANGRSTVTLLSSSGITAKRSSTGTTWTTTAVPGSDQYVSDISLDARPDGAAQVYFLKTSYQGEVSTNDVQRVTLPLTGQATVSTLSKDSQNQQSSLATAVDDAGQDLAYWNTTIDTPDTYSMTFTSGGSLAGPSIANLSFAPPVVDAAGNGNAIVAWNANPGLGFAIRR